MKKHLQIAISIMAGLCFSSNFLIAQPFVMQGNPFLDRYGVTSGAFPNNTKAIGIGQFTVGNPPQSVLHINSNLLTPTTGAPLTFAAGEVFRTDCPNGFDEFWRMQRNGTGRGRIFTQGIGGTVILGRNYNQNNMSVQADTLDITFHTVPLAGNGIGQERMRILGVNQNLTTISPWFATARAGNVGIGTQHPLTMLHMGGEGASGAGWRNWMDIGTFCASRSGFDNAYFGLRNIAGDVHNAVINWGNNPANTSQADRLLFVFTAAPNNGQASTLNGLETGRMIVNLVAANTVRSFTGIGGDPTVNGYSNVANAQDPQNTLEVNSTAPGLIPVNNPNTSNGFSTLNGHPPAPPLFNPPTGFSGLRFTDLTSASVPELNPSGNVLSVDANGDVILVPGNVNAEKILALESRLAALEAQLASLQQQVSAFAQVK